MNYGQPWCRDGISVRNLQLASPPHDGVDAWGRQKEQPVLLSVHLSFKAGFDSAASNDALDTSTMHYGVLSKGLRAISSSGEWSDLAALARRALSIIEQTPPGRDILDHVTIEIKLPKASLLGEAVVFVSDFSFSGSSSDLTQSNMIHLKNICIPTLIGVNSNERLAKQKLVINLWVGGIEHGEGNDYTTLEDRLTEVRMNPPNQTTPGLLTERKVYTRHCV